MEEDNFGPGRIVGIATGRKPLFLEINFKYEYLIPFQNSSLLIHSSILTNHNYRLQLLFFKESHISQISKRTHHHKSCPKFFACRRMSLKLNFFIINRSYCNLPPKFLISLHRGLHKFTEAIRCTPLPLLTTFFAYTDLQKFTFNIFYFLHIHSQWTQLKKWTKVQLYTSRD